MRPYESTLHAVYLSSNHPPGGVNNPVGDGKVSFPLKRRKSPWWMSRATPISFSESPGSAEGTVRSPLFMLSPGKHRRFGQAGTRFPIDAPESSTDWISFLVTGVLLFQRASRSRCPGRKTGCCGIGGDGSLPIREGDRSPVSLKGIAAPLRIAWSGPYTGSYSSRDCLINRYTK
ncbi:hypothetical protein CLV97_12712 [Planifilum fimeticola]|jgi:hypothetical protein|uniref:Uncharacterized protein n=1 Tax=Planifilum fimeticola TaxID=201975 RepID=A0A2T0LBZ3_9BACL|nr:hypothetical protein CLV97_12712 [Planifilum fimeticola]